MPIPRKRPSPAPMDIDPAPKLLTRAKIKQEGVREVSTAVALALFDAGFPIDEVCFFHEIDMDDTIGFANSRTIILLEFEYAYPGVSIRYQPNPNNESRSLRRRDKDQRWDLPTRSAGKLLEAVLPGIIDAVSKSVSRTSGATAG